MTLSKKVLKHSLAMFLTFAMIFVLIPQNAFAAVGEIDTGYDDNETTMYIGPVVHLTDEYAKGATQEDIDALKQASVNASKKGLLKATPVFEEDEYDEMVAYVRSCLVNRQSPISVTYKQSEDKREFMGELLEQAMEHTGVGNEGDYIERSYGGWSYRASGTNYGNQIGWTPTYTITYYTTKAQEDVLANEIDEVLDSLNLEGKTDYQKFKDIYDYICDHITYDHTNLNNTSYYLKYTAYAALVNKTAVCQGYACLLYRMLLDAGVDNRIITGLANGGAGSGGHAWNIVKPDAYWFYYVDSTWDATYKQAGRAYPYFLKSLGNFGNHYPGTKADGGREERIDEILATYPIATSNYVVCSHAWNNVLSVEKAATTSADGSKVVGCSKCIEKKQAVIKRIGNVSLSQTSYTYDGSAKKPSVTVTDANGATISSGNYDVVYQNNVNVGKATVTVNFKNEYSGSVSRQFDIIAASVNPQINLVAGDGTITASWNNVSGVTKYRVFTCLNGKYTKIGDTTGNTYTITGLNNGTTYGVFVKSYANGVWAELDETCVKYISPVGEEGKHPIPVLVAGDGKIKASWNAVDGATKYRVFVYYNGKYTKVADTTQLQYTVNNLTNGVKYGVYIKAYVNGEWEALNSNYVRYATPKAQGIEPVLTAGDRQINVKWKAVAGATKYRVFTYRNGTYTKVADTKSTEYTITGLTNGVKYGVYVKAYINGAWQELNANYLRYATPNV